MLRTELDELIRNGENSGVEFKRDDVRSDNLAKEIAALLNLEGGHILLGVEQDGSVSGLARTPEEAEEWVMNVCRDHLRPSIIPYWETIPWDEARVIGILTLPADSPDKPYKSRRASAWVTFVRVGSTSREATREEEARLYQASGLMRYDIKPVPGTGLADLDRQRFENYFCDIVNYDCPPSGDSEEWQKMLLNTDIMMLDRGRAMASVAGLLLFGYVPNRYLPQAGITATAYPGNEKEYATVDEETIRGPLVSVLSPSGEVVENGIIDQAIGFVTRNMGSVAWLEDGRRQRKNAYPSEAVREAIVNALVHRDYSIAVADVELSLYADRLEVISPGRLPNTVTVDKMRLGYRATRNELLKEILRDYRYVEARGMGVRYRIIQGMRQHNNTEPDLIEEEDHFLVRLWKEPRTT